MSKNFALRAVIGAALLAAAGIASAAVGLPTSAPATIVDADLNTFENGVGADSGLHLTAGESYHVSASGDWRNDPNPYYSAGPDGNTVQGPLGQDGLTANYGTLVGQIDGGTPFVIGANFWGTAAASGELELFFWDTDSGSATNNSGTVSATAVVPEPATYALMALGLGLVGLSRRRKI